MAGVTLYAPGPGEEVRSTHVAQFVNLCSGAANGGALVKLNDVSDSASYSVVIGNQDTTNGYALKVQFGAVGSPTTLATFAKSSSRIQSANGTHYLDVSNTGVTITGTFSYNGQSISSGVRVFNVLDYGIQSSTDAIEASAGTAVRAANVTAMDTLMTALLAAGGGDVEFPPHAVNRFYPFTNLTFSHTTGAAMSVGLRGHGKATILKVWGTSNYLFDFAGTAGSGWARSYMRDLQIEAGEKMTSGAAFRLRTVDDFEFRNVQLKSNAATSGVLSIMDIGAPTATGDGGIWKYVRLTDCRFATLTDSTSTGTVTIYPGAGLYITRCDISGYNDGSTGIRFLPQGTSSGGSDFNIIDTVVLEATLIKDHKTGIRAGQSGKLSNLQMIGGHVDGIGAPASTTAVGIYIETTGAGIVENLQLIAPWVAVYATTGNGYGLFVNAATGTVSLLNITDGYWTNCRTSAISINGTSAKPLIVTIKGNQINGGSAANQSEIEVSNGDGVVIVGNRVYGPSNSGYGILAASSVTNLVMVGNNATGKLTGGTVMLGTTSSTRVLSANI